MTQPPPYPPTPPYGAYRSPAPPPTNAMAIAALVSALLVAPLGIVFGHISLSQIRRTGAVPTVPGVVQAVMSTNAGTIGLQLDNGKAPCTVNSFVSLAQQGFFDDTSCHRLTAAADLAVLQCGDPTGTGAGGPGYRFVNEYPTNQYRPFDPLLKQAVRYPRGTLAMANAGPDTNGSQFFIVYRDSLLPPTYTVFGQVDPTGLATVDKIAAAGISGDPEDGRPTKPVTISAIRLE